MQEDELKQLMKGSKLKASENLKYRIIQQIESEKALSKNKESLKPSPIFGNMFAIFGVMYGLIIGLGIMFYISGGMEQILSGQFIIIAGMIASISGFFWLITVFDDRRHEKLMNKKKTIS